MFSRSPQSQEEEEGEGESDRHKEALLIVGWFYSDRKKRNTGKGKKKKSACLTPTH